MRPQLLCGTARPCVRPCDSSTVVRVGGSVGAVGAAAAVAVAVAYDAVAVAIDAVAVAIDAVDAMALAVVAVAVGADDVDGAVGGLLSACLRLGRRCAARHPVGRRAWERRRTRRSSVER